MPAKSAWRDQYRTLLPRLVYNAQRMDKEILQLLSDLHVRNHKQGPSSDQAFQRALELSGIDTKAPLSVADIGCGTGAATVALLQHTNANVTAVDFLPDFLSELTKRAEASGVTDRLTTLEADMGDLPFTEAQFDLIWSEGAIYNIGFGKGIKDWKSYLKPGGVLAVSEITWLRPDVPEPLRSHWEGEYAEVATASEKIALLEQAGYTLVGYFPLSPDCWLDEYYAPLENGFADFLKRNGDSEKAKAIVAETQAEIALYKEYQDYVSYGFYIARKQ